MYSLSQKNDLTWGLQDYEIPLTYFDHIQSFKNKEYLAITLGEKKAAKTEINKNAKKLGMIDEIERKQKNLPEPWKYNIQMNWIKGSKDDSNSQNVPKKFQINKFKWMSTPKEQQTILESKKQGRSKPDMTANKHTFIDEIIRVNSKKNYPVPSSTDYYLDEIAVKKYFPEKASMVFRRNESTKFVKDRFPFNQKKRKERLHFESGKMRKK